MIALRARDHIEVLLEKPEGAEGGAEILADLQKLIQGSEGQAAETASTAPTTTVDRDGSVAYRVRFKLPADALSTGANPFLLLDELRGLGPCEIVADTSSVPLLDDLDPETPYMAWTAELRTAAGRSAITDVFMFMADDMELEITELSPVYVQEAAPPSREAVGASGKEAAAAKAQHVERSGGHEKGGTSLRVAAERLDELMNRVGELVIAQARLAQIASLSADPSLKLVSEELERLASGLRDTTMGIRMVPIGSLFGRFRRLVHDLSADLEKDVTFVTTGEETELDKTVVEKLADPLVHIIRNSIDHGLERPLDRDAASKPPSGTVRLSAQHAGAEVIISIVDDGRGIDAQRVRAKAEENGLIQPDAKLTDAELYQFIFHPGFSTAKEVTSVSGRGVGMDVVKRTIEGLRGSIDVSSAMGVGTTITLRLPLTLAIIDGMLVRVGNSRYTIPLSSVEECVELPVTAERSARAETSSTFAARSSPICRSANSSTRRRSRMSTRRWSSSLRETSAWASSSIRSSATTRLSSNLCRGFTPTSRAFRRHHPGRWNGCSHSRRRAARRLWTGLRRTAEERESSMSGRRGNMTALSIGLEDEIFAIDAQLVREILDVVPITEVPNAPQFINGLINVRGRVVPLADLRVMFGMSLRETNVDTRIVVIDVFQDDGEPVTVGILADRVLDVSDIDMGQVEDAPGSACAGAPNTCAALARKAMSSSSFPISRACSSGRLTAKRRELRNLG